MFFWVSDLSEPDEGVGQWAPDHRRKTNVVSDQHLVDGLHLKPAAVTVDAGWADPLQVPGLEREMSDRKKNRLGFHRVLSPSYSDEPVSTSRHQHPIHEGERLDSPSMAASAIFTTNLHLDGVFLPEQQVAPLRARYDLQEEAAGLPGASEAL